MTNTERGKPFFRTGKWLIEEEIYGEALIRNFLKGALPDTPRCTLRLYLAQKLLCKPMRITKKFTRLKFSGKVFYKQDPQHKEDLSQLEMFRRRFLRVVGSDTLELYYNCRMSCAELSTSESASCDAAQEISAKRSAAGDSSLLTLEPSGPPGAFGETFMESWKDSDVSESEFLGDDFSHSENTNP